MVYVFLPSHRCDFEIVKDAQSVTHRPVLQDSISDNYENPRGVSFVEEEIEDGNGSSVPRIVDLLKHENSSSVSQLPIRNRISEKTSNDLEKPSSVRTMAGKDLHSGSKTEELLDFEDMEFDFDQDLMDTYSDLIGEINPDDFLDLDCMLAKDEGMQEKGELTTSVDYLKGDELEEGEIAD